MHAHNHNHGGHDFDSPETAALTELGSEALIDLLINTIGVVGELCEEHGVAVHRVLDLGCGPGVGTGALAQRFGSANVLAVDGSAAMLERAAARAERLGVADRVTTRAIEFPDGLGDLGRSDVVWASMVIHHIGDEADALARVRRLVEPGGLLALVERGQPLRVLPDDSDLGRAGVLDRLDAAWAEWFGGMRADLPGVAESADYPEMLERAGFELLDHREVSLMVEPPLDDKARNFAHGDLTRAREHLADHADPADLKALDLLIDQDAHDSILHRDDAILRASRHLYVAR